MKEICRKKKKKNGEEKAKKKRKKLSKRNTILEKKYSRLGNLLFKKIND